MQRARLRQLVSGLVRALAALGLTQIVASALAQNPDINTDEVQKRLQAMPPEKRQKLLQDLSNVMDKVDLMNDLQSGKCARAPEVRIKVIQGDPEGMYTLSDMYKNGWCVPKDYPRFHAYLEQAARGGSKGAAFDLGYFLQLGNEGYPTNAPVAAQWYEAAIQRGEPRAMVQLGQMLLAGDTGKVDAPRGLKLLETAASLGDENIEASNKALADLALDFLEGKVVRQNIATSRRYALRGAAQCDGGSMTMLAMSYRLEQPPNVKTAYAWADAAVAHTPEARMHGIATSTLDDATKVLSPGELAKAKALAKKLPICLPAEQRNGNHN